MALQRDTINMQTSYNTKLLASTKDAIEAYEIGTVEWNSNYSATSDSKRRDITASINTFTTSLANNLGIGGTSKETILTYIPAIAYTLYDGYYIYSPAETRITIKDENEVTVTMKKELVDSRIIKGYTYEPSDKDKILYKPKTGIGDGTYNGKYFTLDPTKADTEYKHILKPFSAYSKEYNDVIINYTLDNYITVYSKIDEKYAQKSGYLVNKNRIQGVNGSNNNISNIKLDNQDIKPEYLSERIAYYDENSATMQTETYNYVYSTDNVKIYIDDSKKCFELDHDGRKTYLDDITSGTYKKCVIPSGKELYQRLDSSSKGLWFEKISDDIAVSDSNVREIADPSTYGLENNNIDLDYSAINYCVESYLFTEWASKLRY